MKRVARLVASLSLCLAFGAAGPVLASTDWPHFRGPAMDGRLAAPGALPDDGLGLDVAYRIPVGSAYSGIAIVNGRVVTMFADGDADWVGAFAAESGKPAWRFRLADKTVGRNGAHDGPLSSPVVAGDLVFALASQGRLAAIDLASGELRWEKDLSQEWGGRAPDFGYTTTPVFGSGILVVQVGGESKGMVGINARTGDTVWSTDGDQVAWQSPAIMNLAGRDQVVAVSNSQIVGIALTSGERLWSHPLEEGERARSANPAFIDGDRFAVYVSGDLRAYRVSRSAEGFGVTELYRSKNLGGNYAPPVHHEGHLYGFRGRVLSCVDAATGDRVWRSREPGGDGLILVDGKLVIFGAKGNVVVAEASPSGYRELARVQALDGSSLTWPSFADGRIFVRNLQEMAAIRVARGKRTATVTRSGGGSPFATWVVTLSGSDNPQKLVNDYFASQEQLPVVEGEHVHFVFRSTEANDVAIAGTMNNGGAPEPMTHVAGTDLFYRSYELLPAAHWEYRFQVDFESWVTDPENPMSVPMVDGDEEMSALMPAGYAVPAALKEPEGARGREDEFVLKSEALGYEKPIHVWLPPGYDDGEASYPLLLVLDADAWMEKGQLLRALDNMVGRTMAPAVVAMVGAHRAWWTEAGGSRNTEFAAMQATELLPELQRRYRLSKTAGGHAILANRFYAFSGAYVALAYPEVFGKAALQSPYMGLGNADQLMAKMEACSPEKVAFYLDWNRFDERNIDRDWDFGRDSRSLDEALRKHGFQVQGGEMADSYGWGAWRTRLPEVLATLLPPDGSADGGR